jgi:hypothetical protein
MNMNKKNKSVDMDEIKGHLRGVAYPATRDDLVTAAKVNDAPDSVTRMLDNLPADETYETPADVEEILKDTADSSGVDLNDME